MRFGEQMIEVCLKTAFGRRRGICIFGVWVLKWDDTLSFFFLSLSRFASYAPHAA